jgi:DNA-binding CsgD family transcriptional regulator
MIKQLSSLNSEQFFCLTIQEFRDYAEWLVDPLQSDLTGTDRSILLTIASQRQPYHISDREFAARLGISRVTLRNSIARLVDRMLLSKPDTSTYGLIIANSEVNIAIDRLRATTLNYTTPRSEWVELLTEAIAEGITVDEIVEIGAKGMAERDRNAALHV